MKHLSVSLTVLLLGALPLAAAARDYGANQMLLAAEAGAPQLPTATMQPDPTGPMPKPEALDGEGAADATPGTSRATPAAPVAPGAPSRNREPPPPSSTPHGTLPSSPAREPGPASWRSLLPGSIQ